MRCLPVDMAEVSTPPTILAGVIMSVYNPSGSGDVHISKAVSGKKKTGVVPTIKSEGKGTAKKPAKKVTKKTQ